MTQTATRRVRPVLSRDGIAETALRMTLERPFTPLTLARLGAELSADPTALYRHYRSRDDLIRELGDRLFGEMVGTLEAAEATNDWEAMLGRVTTVMRTVLLRRPALAADLGTRFTGGPNEQRGVALVRGILERAGFPSHDASVQARAFGELVLSAVVMTASMMSLPSDAQEFELEVSRSLYGGDVRGALEYEDTTFDSIFETYLLGLRARLGHTNGTTEGANMNHHERGER